MKIRTGFVSNSSSSNFIIDNSYDTVFDLATNMLEIRNSDSASWGRDEFKNISKAIRAGRDLDTPIYFSTCNYDTFIKKVLGFYIVTTCNNHPFIHELEGVIQCPSEIKEWLGENNYLTDYDGPLPFTEEIETWDFQCGEVFWQPEYDLMVSRYNYMEAQRNGDKNAKAYCKDKDHFADMMVLAINKKIICPVCYSRERDNQEPGIENRFEILDL